MATTMRAVARALGRALRPFNWEYMAVGAITATAWMMNYARSCPKECMAEHPMRGWRRLADGALVVSLSVPVGCIFGPYWPIMGAVVCCTTG
jgi:hypothetical protein